MINYFQLLLFFQICWWDSREGGQPAGMIPMDQCHIDPVYKTIWLNAKAGTEFFTGSTDGMVRFFKRLKILECVRLFGVLLLLVFPLLVQFLLFDFGIMDTYPIFWYNQHKIYEGKVLM